MQTITVKGLVIKQTNYGEADRILHIFTDELGIVSAIAKGARKYKSHQGSASQLLYYSSFTLAGSRGMYTLRGASTIESFFELSQSLEKLSLVTYLFDITNALIPEGIAEKEALSLLLNTLYIIKTKNRPLALIKAAYELKLLAITGFMAECENCIVCSSNENASYFSPSQGGIICKNCQKSMDAIEISQGVCDAMNYILNNDSSKIFSFTLSNDALSVLGHVCEKFLISCAERDFMSLGYLKTIMNM